MACVVGLALRVRHRWARIRIIRRKTATGWHHVRVARESQEKNLFKYTVLPRNRKKKICPTASLVCEYLPECPWNYPHNCLYPTRRLWNSPQLLLFHLSTSRSTWSSMKLLKVKVGNVTSNKTHISVCIHKKCTNLPTTQMLWKRHPLLYDMCIGNHQLAHLGIC